MSHNSLPLVKLDNFEGPFDLLLELAATEKIDISVVSLAAITDAYLEYIQKQPLATAVQADFLVIAATLLLLKIRNLLPELLPPEEAAEVMALTDRLKLYQLYREQALTLQATWNKQPLLPGPERLAVQTTVPFPDYHVDEIATIMQKLWERQQARKPPVRSLRPQGRSLPETIALFKARLAQLQQVIFQTEVANDSPETVAVSFLAILELARAEQVQLLQASHSAPLTISLKQPV